MSAEQFKQLVKQVMESIPFSRFLNLKIDDISHERALVSLAKQPQFIGNHIQGILHGGVISSVLDTVGGVIAMYNLYSRVEDLSFEQQAAKLAKVGTIDIRVDYLRPGRGERFHATAAILRGGNKVAVTKMEFYNETQELLACGTGTYLIG
ncbi:MAG: thioesterase family protein [Legionellales bacterium]|nr:thioesterase family protein [Legionellales bacterium]